MDAAPLDPDSLVGRFCKRTAVTATEPLPLGAQYDFAAAEPAAVALAVGLTKNRPHLRDDVEQAARLAAWECTRDGQCDWQPIDKAVRRAVRQVIDDCTEKRREAADPAVCYLDTSEFDAQGEQPTREQLDWQRMKRIVDLYGVAAVTQFVKWRYGKYRYRSAKWCGLKAGIKTLATRLDRILRRVNPYYDEVLERKREARRASQRAYQARAARAETAKRAD